jgi:hypothetical protein
VGWFGVKMFRGTWIKRLDVVLLVRTCKYSFGKYGDGFGRRVSTVLIVGVNRIVILLREGPVTRILARICKLFEWTRLTNNGRPYFIVSG